MTDQETLSSPPQDRPPPLRVRTFQRTGQEITAIEFDYDIVAPDGSRKTIPMSREVGCLDTVGSRTNVVDPLGLAILTLLDMYDRSQRRLADYERQHSTKVPQPEKPRRGRPPSQPVNQDHV